MALIKIENKVDISELSKTLNDKERETVLRCLAILKEELGIYFPFSVTVKRIQLIYNIDLREIY